LCINKIRSLQCRGYRYFIKPAQFNVNHTYSTTCIPPPWNGWRNVYVVLVIQALLFLNYLLHKHFPFALYRFYCRNSNCEKENMTIILVNAKLQTLQQPIMSKSRKITIIVKTLSTWIKIYIYDNRRNPLSGILLSGILQSGNIP